MVFNCLNVAVGDTVYQGSGSRDFCALTGWGLVGGTKYLEYKVNRLNDNTLEMKISNLKGCYYANNQVNKYTVKQHTSSIGGAPACSWFQKK
jgi:hypothetical protein